MSFKGMQLWKNCVALRAYLDSPHRGLKSLTLLKHVPRLDLSTPKEALPCVFRQLKKEGIFFFFNQ